MLLRASKLLCASILACLSLGAVAAAAGPSLPKTTGGNPVTVFASGLKTPTSFAFGAGQVFAGDGGSQAGTGGGGVFVLQGGNATLVPGSPAAVFGLAWHLGTLYVSTGPSLLAWSGWNGTTFTHHKVIFSGSKKFTGFEGIAFGADGRLYAGVALSFTGDHGPPTTPYAYDVLSMKPNGKGLKVFASGIRQPWQMAFPSGSSAPFVSDLGQDSGAKNPPDFVLRVHNGDNFGFPQCNWTKKSACKGFAKPFKFFAPHTNVGGLAIIGNRLYMSEFGFAAPLRPAEVASVPLAGGPVRPLLTGFVAPVIGLGAHGGFLYVGELTGQVFRVKP